jgi:DNA-binding NarL/FixJ family response regulator
MIPAAQLTQRELEIVSCLVRGMTNREISRELYVAESTVKAHLHSTFAKLGVSNRTQAAIVALGLENLPMPGRDLEAASKRG